MPTLFRSSISAGSLGVITILAVSCQFKQLNPSTIPVFITPTASGPTRPTETTIEKSAVASNLQVVDFGWTAKDQIYYGVGGDPGLGSAQPVTDINETAWYAYDIKDQKPTRTVRPYPRLDTSTVRSLEHSGTVNILYMTVSPKMDKAIYTRLPKDYERPKPLPHDYIDPAEIWVTENPKADQNEGASYPLLNNKDHLYDCGSALSAESHWFMNESLVFGSCHFTYGITQVYFLADLSSRSIQFLDFKNEAGDYTSAEEISVAHNTPSLAFGTSDGFWVVPVENGIRKIPLQLSELNLLFNDRPAVAPVWSADDQWIYYWTLGKPTKYDENGFVAYQPWWLEKINLATRQRVVILSEKDLLSVLGYDIYRRHVPSGTGNPWRLSPDEKGLLLFLSQTVDTTANLFMITW